MVVRRKLVNPKKPSSNWDLYKDGISYSLLSKWLVCKERMRLYAVEGLVQKSDTDARSFGTLFHKLLELGHTCNHDYSMVSRQYQTYCKKETWLTQKEQVLILLADATYQAYCEKYRITDLAKEYIYQEEAFRVPYVLPSGRIVDLRGRWDQVYREGRRRTFLQENKTKSRIDGVSLAAFLPHNLQTMMYATTFFLREGYELTGVMLNVIRNTSLRQRSKETPNQFAKRLLEDIASRPDFYFHRNYVEFGHGDLKRWQQQYLNPILEDVCDWWESIEHDPFNPWVDKDGLPNRKHYPRPFGLYDPFAYGKGDYFDKVTRGSNVGLQKIESPFPELDEETDENEA